MRRGAQNTRFIIDGDNFYGVSLGYDFTAEHEWGIGGIKRKFGIPSNTNDGKTPLMGVESRTITKGKVLFNEDDNLCVLTSYRPWSSKEDFQPSKLICNDIKGMYRDLECAWDEGDFCVATNKKEDFPKLRELYDAFQNNNIVITFLKSEMPVFSNSSLSILILDKLPQEVKDEMYRVDKKAYDLIDYEKAIGVTKLKEDAKKIYRDSQGKDKTHYFMACSPYWIDYENEKNRNKRKKEMGTKYDIMFWINYSDDDNNYGWYKAEDIIQWLSTPGLKLTSLN